MLLPMLHDVNRAAHGRILAQLADLVDAGVVEPLLDDTRFAIPETGAAYAHLKSGQALGKVVIEL